MHFKAFEIDEFHDEHLIPQSIFNFLCELLSGLIHILLSILLIFEFILDFLFFYYNKKK